VGEAIARLHPCAVDISSGVESAKGIKDAVLMAEFIQAVRIADSKTQLR
jgi:phosphoribosylanthranilate isomerase